MSTRLKQVRQDRGWSQTRLIHAMCQQADTMDIRLATRESLKTQISRWENGHRMPDDVHRQVFRAVYGMSDAELGLVDAGGPGLSGVGLDFADTWLVGVDTVTNLWRQDVSRRQLLRGTAFAATAYSVPALHWLVSDSPEEVVKETGRRVGLPTIQSIREMTATYRRLDNAQGGGLIRSQAVAYLDREVAPLLKRGSFDGATGLELMRATAELTQLVGWMAYDATEHGLSQRYLIQALRLADAAGDRSLGTEIVAAMSHQASYLGEASSAVDLARVASREASAAGIRALEAEAAVLEAQGHAERQDEKACAASLHLAEVALDRADRSNDPQWISYLDEAYMSAKFGHCFRALGQPKQAEKFAQRSLSMDPAYVRGRAFNLSLLAGSYAQQGEVEKACATGREALGLTRMLTSVRALKYVSGVADQLADVAGSSDAVAFRRDVAQLVAAA